MITNIVPLITLGSLWVCAYYLLRQAKKTGKCPHIRKIPALDAIKEAVGRAAEMNRPVLLLPGDAVTLRGADAAETQAGLSIVSYGTRLCVQTGAKEMVMIGASAAGPVGAEVLPLIIDSARGIYDSEGKPEDFRPDSIQYVSGDQMSFAAGVMGTIVRQKAGCNIMIGPWQVTSVPIALAGMEAGALQIGGTSRVIMMPMFVAFCDYALLGEEVFAAAAYVSGDPAQVATIAAGDLGKYITIVLLLLGAVLGSMGSGVFLSLMRL
jgi:hypothetical protein